MSSSNPALLFEKLLAETTNNRVFRGLRNQEPVVAKVLKHTRQTPKRIAALQHEYTLLQRMSHVPNIVRAIALETTQAQEWALIFEDSGGVALSQLPLVGVIEPSLLFFIAERLSEALEEIHRLNILHKDINPANIVMNPETGQIQLIDFSSAGWLVQEQTSMTAGSAIEGTIAYVAPEQTGRMNRSIDNRSDLYSLGITLYELITGQHPFSGITDPMEMTHAHLAIVPPSPHQIKTRIPAVLSHIIMKLIEKEPDRRYQSAQGLRADLQECQHQLITSGRIDSFELGTHDITDRFVIPNKLYGREANIAALRMAVENAEKERAELLLISGEPGIGKTALVREFIPITANRMGYYLEGKFDQLQREIPYRGIADAFRGLIKHILSEDAARIQEWNRQFSTALGENAAIVTAVIPELKLVIGEQPLVAQLSPSETQQRFNYTFQNFVRVFSVTHTPLVLFLDDVQWIDNASLKLIEWLLSDPELTNLLVVFAYRSSEVDDVHPIWKTLRVLRDSGLLSKTIHMRELEISDVIHFLQDTMSLPANAVDTLGRIVHEKTGGNPFFLRQFIASVYDQGLIYFDRSASRWLWNEDEIKSSLQTTSIAEFVTHKIAMLPLETQRTLQTAAVMGNRFNLHALCVTLNSKPEVVAEYLAPALTDMFILPSESNYRFAGLQIDSELQQEITFVFAHDRIQQAAYEMLNTIEKGRLHWQVGWLLLESIEHPSDRQRFEIIDHLLAGSALVSSEKEIETLGQNLVVAAKAALDLAASDTALRYFEAAIHLLPADAWQTRYESILNIYNAATRAAFMNNRIDRMNEFIQIIESNAATFLDQIPAQLTRLEHLAISDHVQSTEYGLNMLKTLGITVPIQPTNEDLALAANEVMQALMQLGLENLVSLPDLHDPTLEALQQIMVILFSPTFLSNKRLFALLAMIAVKLCVQNGFSMAGMFSTGMFGLFFIVAGGNTPLGKRIYETAILAAEQRSGKGQPLIRFTALVSGQFIMPLRSKSDKDLENASQLLNTGNIVYALNSMMAGTLDSFLSSAMSLSEAYTANQSAIAQFLRLNYTGFAQMLQSSGLLIKLLSDGDSTLLYPGFYDTVSHWKISATLIGVHEVCAQIANYLFGKFELAQTISDRIVLIQEDMLGPYYSTLPPFYHALTYLALIHTKDAQTQVEYLARVDATLEIYSAWKTHAPENFSHKYDLISAERARATGDRVRASELYDQAIEGARQNRFLNEQALACELAGKFYLSIGRDRLGVSYLYDAVSIYNQWGAIAKANQVVSQIPAQYRLEMSDSQDNFATLSISSDEIIDLSSFAKVFGTISQEITLKTLLQQLMILTLQNAGAQRGSLVIQRGSELVLATSIDAGDDQARLLPFPLLSTIGTDYPVAPEIVSYVARTKEVVILDNAAQTMQFNRSSYIISRQPKSVLCAPLIHQQQVIGVIYLENNLVAGMFTPNRVETIQLLSSQMAIALNNALLVERLQEAQQDLEKRVEARTRDLQIAADVSRQITTILDLDELLNTIVQSVQDAYQFHHVAIYLREAEGALKRYPEISAEQAAVDLTDNSIVAQVARNGLYKLINESHPGHLTNGNGFAVGSELALPLLISGELIGVLNLQSHEQNRFGDADIQVLTTLADQLAIAVENARLYQEQAKTAETLRSVDQLKSRFLASMSHELRTPLNAILNYADFMARGLMGSTNDEQKNALGKIHSSGKHLLELINDVLDIAKIEAGMMTMFVEVGVDVRREIDTVLDAVRPLLANRPIRFVEDIDYALPPMNCDRRRFRQVALNLLSNALKFTEKGVITLSIKHTNNTILLCVSDTGPGIAPEDQARIFEPFQQSEIGISQGGGTGLGLPISRSIVESHGGSMWVESEIGDGTTFFARFPLNVELNATM